MCACACVPVCPSVGHLCWPRSWTVRKRLNRSSCRFGADSRGPKKWETVHYMRPKSDESIRRCEIWQYNAQGWAVQKRVNRSRCRFRADSMLAQGSTYQVSSRMNPFAALRDDKTVMRPFVKILWPLVIINVTAGLNAIG